MATGYHRLDAKLMARRDEEIICLMNLGVRHKIIAYQVRMEPSGFETRLHKLRLDGKLPPAGGSHG